MSENREAVQQILNYIRMPDCKFSGIYKYSEEVAITRWAGREIVKAIWDDMDTPASITVRKFYSEMIRCAQNSKRQKLKHLFMVAADAADIIAAMI